MSWKGGLLKISSRSKIVSSWCVIASRDSRTDPRWTPFEPLFADRHFWQKTRPLYPRTSTKFLIFCWSRCGPRFERFLPMYPWSHQEAVSRNRKFTFIENCQELNMRNQLFDFLNNCCFICMLRIRIPYLNKIFPFISFEISSSPEFQFQKNLND